MPDTRYVLSGDKPRAVVVFAHGIHADGGKSFVMRDGRKLSIALLREILVVEKGYALYTLDAQGHGFSEGHRFYVPSYELNRNDLVDFAKYISDQPMNQNVPFFLSGESYGGNLCLHACAVMEQDASKRPANYKGQVLLAPAVIGDVPPAAVVFVLRRLLAPFFPRWTPFFMPNPVSADRIWRDEEAREANLDPERLKWGLTNGGSPFQLGTGVSLLLATLDVRSKAIPKLATPFCVIHGKDDAAVLPEGTVYLDEHAVNVKKEDRKIHLLPECYHDVLGDPLAPEAMELMVEFMEDRLQN